MTALLPGAYGTSNTSTPAGNTVASVFGSFFRDANQGVTVGIAVSSVTGNGVWQFSTNAGASWSNITAPSTTNALLLSANDMIRFVPSTMAAGAATLMAHAWDGSVGTDGNTANLTVQGTGGPSASSATTLTAVCNVNTAPDLTTTNVTLSAVNETVASAALTAATLLAKAGYSDADGTTVPSGIAINADAGPGAWQWLNGATWIALPSLPANSAFLLPGVAQVRFKPADNLANAKRFRDSDVPRLGRNGGRGEYDIGPDRPRRRVGIQHDGDHRGDDGQLRQAGSGLEDRH